MKLPRLTHSLGGLVTQESIFNKFVERLEQRIGEHQVGSLSAEDWEYLSAAEGTMLKVMADPRAGLVDKLEAIGRFAFVLERSDAMSHMLNQTTYPEASRVSAALSPSVLQELILSRR